MLVRKINIINFLSEKDKQNLLDYSRRSARLYNLCLSEIKKSEKLDFKIIYPITKDFSKQNNLPAKQAQNVGISLINNIKGYYSKRKNDKKTKIPHKEKELCTLEFDSNIQRGINGLRFGGGFSLKGNVFKLNILDLTIDFSKCEWFSSELININTLKLVQFKFKDNKIYIIFTFSELPKIKETKNKEFLSIDLGISSIATIYNSVTKSPIKIQTKRFKGLERRNNLINSKIDKKKKNIKKNKEIYSKRFKRLLITKKRIQNKLTNKRKDYLHKASRKIINICSENKIDNIIIGDIQTKKLKKDYKCKLNKSTQSEGLLSRFKSFIEYKAKRENISFFKINEAHTSQTNCITGNREFSSDMSIREVEILPSVFIDRDVNSTINIAKKYGDLWLSHDFNYENLLKLEKINVIL